LNDRNSVELLCKARSKIDFITDFGFTPLMMAKVLILIGEGSVDIVNVLTSYGATITKSQEIKIADYIRSITSEVEEKTAPKTVSTHQAVEVAKNFTKELKKVQELVTHEAFMRKNFLSAEDLENQEIIRRSREEKKAMNRLKNIAREFEEKRESLATSRGNSGELTQQMLPKDNIENLLRRGVSLYDKQTVQILCNELLVNQDINIEIDDQGRYSFKAILFDLKRVTFDWFHIINIQITFIYDYRSKLYRPSFKGGHIKEVIENLINEKLVEKISESRWPNGCIEYTLKNIWTNECFTKTVFPEAWNIEKIFKAITEGKIKKQENFEEGASFSSEREIIVEYEQVVIKIILAKEFFENKIITPYPLKEVAQKLDSAVVAKPATAQSAQVPTNHDGRPLTDFSGAAVAC
jgi:hypothetical protein